jgi:4-aminobutyrate aminotransferase
VSASPEIACSQDWVLSSQAASEGADAVLYCCLERGLSLETIMGDVLTLRPPLIVSQTEMDQVLDILDAAIGEVEAGERA